MATPEMLQPRDGARPRIVTATGPDPVASLAVLLLGVLVVALSLGAVLAVYDWTTPGAMRPLFFAALGIFLAVVGGLVLTAAVRHLRAELR
jgi:hypothetical protein